VDLRSGEGLLRFEILSERWCEMFYCEITPKLSIIFSERRRLDRSSCKKFHEAFLHIYVYIYIIKRGGKCPESRLACNVIF
jgi:hypothetical protein